MKINYKVERVCTNCENKDVLGLSKREAAFELFDFSEKFGKQCPQCSEDCFNIFYDNVTLDSELLKEWSKNLDLFLMPQDEELLLADEKYLDIIIQVLDTSNLLERKRDLLIDSLCIIVYDNTIDENREKDEKLKNTVIKELNLRIDKVKLADDSLMPYVKEIVFPQLKF